MVCIYCGSETSVINSRPQKRVNRIWRRRQCIACTAVMTTSESIDLLKSLVVHNNKHLKPFSRDKLFLSVYNSLMHRKTALNDASWLTDTIISKCYPLITNSQLSTDDIGTSALSVLKSFDKVASVHYMAFHPQK